MKRDLDTGFGDKVTTKDISLATRQLATMIDAGLPIVQCLDILAQQSESKLLCKTVSTVKKDVEGGSTLADALRKHPKIFDDLYVNMVEAGEAGGILNTILNRIALFIEKANRLKKKGQRRDDLSLRHRLRGGHCRRRFDDLRHSRIRRALRRHGQRAAAADADLYRHQQLVRRLLVRLVAGLVGVFMGISFYYKTPHGRMNIDRLMLRMPIIGDLLRKVAVARFSRTCRCC